MDQEHGWKGEEWSRESSHFKGRKWTATKGWRGKHWQSVGGGLQEFNTRVPSDLPVIEGFDEDARGSDATLKDQLILFASYGDDGAWASTS
jgi:hypothetical protein